MISEFASTPHLSFMSRERHQRARMCVTDSEIKSDYVDLRGGNPSEFMMMHMYQEAVFIGLIN